MERIETVTISDFLAMCGGILGLFVGFSALSVIELIYYPTLRLFWMIWRMKTENDEDAKETPGETSHDKEERTNSKKWTSRLRNYLVECCDNSNIHGVRYFSERKLNWSDRSYWAICCLVSLSLCCWMIYNVWIQWQTNPVSYRTIKKLAIDSKYPLPTVTICPEVKTTKQKLNLTFALNNLSNLSDIEFHRLMALTNVCPLLPHLIAFEDKFVNESIYDIIQDIAPQFQDTLTACLWDVINIFHPCSPEITPIFTDEGLCFAFNALNSHEMYTNEMAPGMMMVTGNPNISHWSLENGYDSGFYADVYPNRLKNLGSAHISLILISIDKRNFEHHCNHFDGGFKLILTPPGEVMKMSRNYFRIHLKRHNSIHFEYKMMNTSDGLRRYAPDERKCFYQSERRLRFFKMYTQANCEEECLANFLSLECGCVHFSMPRDNKTNICGGVNVLCLKAAERKLLTGKSNSAFHSKCNCLPACVSIEYKAQRHQNGLDSKFLTSKDKSKKTALIILSLEKVILDERIEKFTVTDFLAMCGGLLGICLGISVLSLIEIIYFVTLRLFWAILGWKSKNSVVPLNPKSIEEVTIADHDE